MRIEFIKPAPGYAYSEGMAGILTDEDAQALIDGGYAKAVEDKIESDLPEDFPFREKLIAEGFGMIADLEANIEVIEQIEGIGKKSYEKIVERLKK